MRYIASSERTRFNVGPVITTVRKREGIRDESRNKNCERGTSSCGLNLYIRVRVLARMSVRRRANANYGAETKRRLMYQDIQLRLSSLPSSRGAGGTRLCLATSPTAPELMLDQLVAVRNSVIQCLDIVDVSTWTGDPLNATFIYSQLHLLHETILEARQMLKGEDDVKGKWWETSADENVSALSVTLRLKAVTDSVNRYSILNYRRTFRFTSLSPIRPSFYA